MHILTARFFLAALLLFGTSPARAAGTLPAPEVATPAANDRSNLVPTTAWIAANTATSVAGNQGAVTAAEIAAALNGQSISAATTTATGGTTARTLAAQAADRENVLSQTQIIPDQAGAGAPDFSGAFNAALTATRNGSVGAVYGPCGTYHITHAIQLGTYTATQSQGIFGDGGCTIIDVDSDFDPTASGELILKGTNGNFYFPTPVVNIRGLHWIFHQPPDLILAATAAVTSGSTITVAAGSPAPQDGNYVVDATTPNVIPQYGDTTHLGSTTVVSVTGTGPYTVGLSQPVQNGGVLNSDSIHFGPSRAQFKTLAAGCTTTIGGSGCIYPPAIYGLGIGQPRIEDVLIEGASTCLYLHGQAGQNSGGGGSTFLNGVRCGALSVGEDFDGIHNFDKASAFTFWPFGLQNQPALSQTYYDGTTVAANLGAMDGSDLGSIETFGGIVNLTPTWSWGSFEYIALDGNLSQVVAHGTSTGFAQIGKLYFTGGGSQATPQVTVESGDVIVGQIDGNTSSASAPINVTGGILHINGGTLLQNVTSTPLITESAGGLVLFNTVLNTPASSFSVPLIKQTGGWIAAANDNFIGGGSGIGVSVGADNLANYIGPMGWLGNAWTLGLPTFTTRPSGNYWDWIYANSKGSGGAPAVSACGTSPSTDGVSATRSGTITAGSGTVTSCTLTFSSLNKFNVWNHCRVTPHSTVASFAYSYTLTAITITGTSLTSDVFDYDCDGY